LARLRDRPTESVTKLIQATLSIRMAMAPRMYEYLGSLTGAMACGNEVSR
jgi:hypothetical protein